jgi:hypothetical protein
MILSFLYRYYGVRINSVLFCQKYITFIHHLGFSYCLALGGGGDCVYFHKKDLFVSPSDMERRHFLYWIKWRIQSSVRLLTVPLFPLLFRELERKRKGTVYGMRRDVLTLTIHTTAVNLFPQRLTLNNKQHISRLLHICVLYVRNETNLMQYLSSVYSIVQWICFSVMDMLWCSEYIIVQ